MTNHHRHVFVSHGLCVQVAIANQRHEQAEWRREAHGANFHGLLLQALGITPFLGASTPNWVGHGLPARSWRRGGRGGWSSFARSNGGASCGRWQLSVSASTVLVAANWRLEELQTSTGRGSEIMMGC
jgi:hypothetical protein